MGISGLLPLLKSITETKTIGQYRGQTLAIDGYCWLHRAIYCCSQEICLGEDTDKYVIYFIDRINALLENGVTPYVVFDGGPLPMKKGTEEERRASRAKNKELGLQCLRQKKYSEARKYFVRAADVSPYMAHCVIRRLKAMNVQYVVAPYEADAQLAFLMKNRLVDGVITEDSDCLPFGCSKVLFKMDRDGIAQEVRTENLKHNSGFSFHMFTDQMFLEMCIFSGCDYLPSLPGFALKKAYALMKQHGTYTKILRALRMEGKVRIPPTYEAEFERAILTFHHQRVYDPATKQLVPLTPIPPELMEQESKADFLGPIIPDDVAQAIAEGDVDPITMTRFASQPPVAPHQSSQSMPRSTSAKHAVISHRTVAAKSAQPVPPQKAPIRSLPAWMSRKRSQGTTPSSSPPSSSAPTPAASTPKSHFFAARDKKLSPTDESSTSLTVASLSTPSSQVSVDSSSFDSQDPSEIDVARSISFSPMDDKVKQMHRQPLNPVSSTGDKENTTPNSSTKPVTENAFARMMRAGAVPQKQSLKRKAPPSVNLMNKSGRFLSRHYNAASPLDLIKRHAFARATSDDKEPATGPADPEPDSEPGSELMAQDISQSSFTRSSQGDESVNFKKTVEENGTTKPPSAPAMPLKATDAFARFRFAKAT